MRRRPPRSTLFPSTSLCRSVRDPLATGETDADRAQVAHARATTQHPRHEPVGEVRRRGHGRARLGQQPDRKSTRLNSSHANISYAVFCLKKKKIKKAEDTDT